MKYCENCERKFLEEIDRCPICGEQLEELLTDEEKQQKDFDEAYVITNMMFGGML